jgi:putative spermidine/putrescine transport system permease protein
MTTEPHGERAWFSGSVTIAVALFLLVPQAILLLQSFTADSYLSFPPASYGLRWYIYIATEPEWITAIINSLIVAAIVTPTALVAGTGAAFALDRYISRGRSAVYAFLVAPMILPHVVLGLTMFRVALWLDLEDTLLCFILAHLTVCIPYVVITVSAAMSGFDRSIEEAAQSLGADKARAVWHVTLPLIRPGLVAGAIFSFITSFDEFIITYFLSTHRVTIPIQVFSSLTYQLEPSVSAISGVTLLLTALLTLLFVTRGQLMVSRRPRR